MRTSFHLVGFSLFAAWAVHAQVERAASVADIGGGVATGGVSRLTFAAGQGGCVRLAQAGSVSVFPGFIHTLFQTGVSSNAVPDAVDDSYSVVAGSSIKVPPRGVLANDTDERPAALTAALTSGTLFGTIALEANGGFLYVPNPGFAGTDNFSYQAGDGVTSSAPATVWLNVSTSRLAFASNVVTGLTSPALAVGDFDGDGDLDLATDGRILLNDGAGLFTTSPVISSLSSASRLETMDLDGDGDADLVKSSAALTNVSLAFNTGGLLFTNRALVNVTNAQIAALDLYPSTVTDLVVASSGQLRVFRGSSGYDPASSTLQNTTPFNALAVADFSGDGLDDLAGSSSLSTSDPSFAWLAQSDSRLLDAAVLFAQYKAAYAVAAGDVDGDLDLDVALFVNYNVGIYYKQAVQLIRNTGGGLLAPDPILLDNTQDPSAYGFEQECALALADLDGDGDQDVLAAYSAYGSNGMLRVFLNDRVGAYPTSSIPFSIGSRPTAMRVADFNGDHRPDIALAHAASPIRILLNASSNPPPGMVGFTPVSGAAGDAVTITGTNFSFAFRVSFGGADAPDFTRLSPTQLVAVVPPGAATGRIAVQTPVGTTTSAASFAVAQVAPTVGTSTPTNGAAGEQMTVYGSGFLGVTSVWIGSISASFTVSSATQLLVTVAGGATGGFIRVSGPGGEAVSGSFFAVVPLALRALALGSGSVVGGAQVAGTLRLNGAATGTLMIAMQNDRPGAVGGATATFLPSAFQAAFAVQTYPVAAVTTARIHAVFNASTSSAQLVLSPPAALAFRETLAFPRYGNITGSESGLAVGDMDGDGLPDVSTGFGGLSLSAGDGLLEEPNTDSAGGSTLRRADITGDGLMDEVSLHLVPDNLLVIRTNDANKFTHAWGMNLSFRSLGLDIADFDGNGRRDIAVGANSTSNGASPLQIFLQTGPLTFAPAALYPGGMVHRGVVVADFNADGRPDVAVSASLSDALYWFPNIGDGLFGLPTSIPVDDEPTSLVTADFDGNGWPDLATACARADTVVVALRWDAYSTTVASIPVGHNPTSLATGDFDGDGSPDLAVACVDDNAVELLGNRGDGSFARRISLVASNQVSALAVADADADGDDDLYAFSATGRGIVLLFQNARFDARRLHPAGQRLLPMSGAALGMRFLDDVDGDGRLDIVQTLYNNGMDPSQLFLARNLGDRAFATTNIEVEISTRGAALADYDGDGDLDPLTFNSYGANWRFYSNGTFTGLLSQAAFLKLPTYFSTAIDDLAAFDADGDGDRDVAMLMRGRTDPVGTTNFIHLGIISNAGPGVWSVTNVSLIAPLPPSANRCEFDAGDLDGNGSRDLAILVTAANPTNTLWIAWNSGTSITGVETHVLSDVGFALEVLVRDFTGDGKADIAVSGTNALLQLLLRAGSGFSTSSIPLPLAAHTLRASDMDADGDADILCTFGSIFGSPVDGFVLRNDGAGHFAVADELHHYDDVQGAAVADDLDGDGAPDLTVVHDSRWLATNILDIVWSGHSVTATPARLRLSPTAAGPGSTVTATIELDNPAPTSGARVFLSANFASLLLTNAVTVPSGQTSQTFSITFSTNLAGLNAVIGATRGITHRTATFAIDPLQLSQIAFAPTGIVGGLTATGTVFLNGVAPAGGAAISLASLSSGLFVPSSILVPAGATNASFNALTSTVASPTQSVVRASNSVSSLLGYLLVLPGDTDGDGMPDWWELQYFPDLGTSGTGTDSDDDGHFDRAEYIAGTIPTNRASLFRILAISNNTSRSITFTSETNRLYDLRIAPTPAGSWSNIHSAIPGTGAPLSLPATNELPVGLYQIRVTAP